MCLYILPIKGLQQPLKDLTVCRMSPLLDSGIQERKSGTYVFDRAV